MKPETTKKIWDFIIFLLLLLACVLLIVNYILLRSDSTECVRDPKEFLIKHFEKITGGNITCTCLSDVVIDRTKNERGGGYKIIFSSFGHEEEGFGFSGELYEDITIKP